MKKVSKKLENLSSDEGMIGLYNAEIEDEKIKLSMREEGKLEGINQRNIEIAKSMLKEGFDIKSISKITSIPIEEINKLK